MTTYLIKSSILLLLMFGLYWFVLRKEKIFVFNRFFLLVSIIFSLLSPLVSFPINSRFTFPVNEILSTYHDFIPGANSAEDFTADVERFGDSSTDNKSLSSILLTLYLFGMVFFLIRFTRNIYVISRRSRISEKINSKGYQIFLTKEKSTPCCFLKNIFLNKEDFQNNRIDFELINHEIEHARQSHTIDILFIEVLKIFYWFNPVFILYNNAIRINHEYLADHGVIRKNYDITTYANKLVNFIAISKSIPLTSSSNYSSTKKRIFMLTKSKSRKSFVGIRIILTLSLMTLVFILQSFQNSGKDVNGFVVSKYGKHLSGAQINLSDQNNKITSDAMGHFVIKNIPEHATITISAKNYISQTVTPIFSSEMVIRLTPDVSTEELKKNFKDFFPEAGSNPLIVINGVIEERVSMADIDPTNKVASLKILSEKAASTKYGEKAKNGAIEIITINDNSAVQTVKIPPANSPENKAKTLVLLDGKVYTGDINDIPIQSVKNLSVRNYTDAYDKYGEKGKEKVVEITTK